MLNGTHSDDLTHEVTKIAWWKIERTEKDRIALGAEVKGSIRLRLVLTAINRTKAPMVVRNNYGLCREMVGALPKTVSVKWMGSESQGF